MLRPKKKLTKKELKHDPLLDSLEKGKEFYEEHSKEIVSALVVVVIIILLGWGWMNSRETARNEAMLANTKATLAAVAGFNDNVVAELERVAGEYGSNSNINQANFQLGIARINADDFSGARDLFFQLSKSSDKQVKLAAKLKLAYLNELESNYADAGDLYTEVAAMDAGLVSKYAKLQAGYAYQTAGNRTQAEIVVTDLLAEDPVGKFKESVKYLEGKVLEK